MRADTTGATIGISLIDAGCVPRNTATVFIQSTYTFDTGRVIAPRTVLWFTTIAEASATVAGARRTVLFAITDSVTAPDTYAGLPTFRPSTNPVKPRSAFSTIDTSQIPRHGTAISVHTAHTTLAGGMGAPHSVVGQAARHVANNPGTRTQISAIGEYLAHTLRIPPNVTTKRIEFAHTVRTYRIAASFAAVVDTAIIRTKPTIFRAVAAGLGAITKSITATHTPTNFETCTSFTRTEETSTSFGAFNTSGVPGHIAAIGVKATNTTLTNTIGTSRITLNRATGPIPHKLGTLTRGGTIRPYRCHTSGIPPDLTTERIGSTNAGCTPIIGTPWLAVGHTAVINTKATVHWTVDAVFDTRAHPISTTQAFTYFVASATNTRTFKTITAFSTVHTRAVPGSRTTIRILTTNTGLTCTIGTTGRTFRFTARTLADKASTCTGIRTGIKYQAYTGGIPRNVAAVSIVGANTTTTIQIITPRVAVVLTTFTHTRPTVRSTGRTGFTNLARSITTTKALTLVFTPRIEAHIVKPRATLSTFEAGKVPRYSATVGVFFAHTRLARRVVASWSKVSNAAVR